MAAAATAPGDEGRMTLVEHLTELRSRLIKCVVAVAVGMVVAFLLYDPIFDLLIHPYREVATPENSLLPDDLLVTDPLAGFTVRMRLALYGGIAFAMPVLLWQLWRFVTPALYPHEKRYAIPFLASALTLFVLGAGLAYLTLPQALDFLNSIGGDDLVAAYAPDKYFQLITYMMLAFGVGFEFPILLIFLQLVGVVRPGQLWRGFRFAAVGITIVVAVITPSGDPISMLMLSIPMILFYLAAIGIGVVIGRRRDARER